VTGFDALLAAALAMFLLRGAVRGAASEAVSLMAFAGLLALGFAGLGAVDAVPPVAAAAWLATAIAVAWVLGSLAGRRGKGHRRRFRPIGAAMAFLQGAAAVILVVLALVPAGAAATGFVADAWIYEKLSGFRLATPLAGTAPAEGARVAALPPPAHEAQRPNRPVAWTRLTRNTDSRYRALPGSVRAVDRAPISFDVSGRVVEMTVEIGEPFEAGEVLARLDPSTLRLAVEEQQSAVVEAAAASEEARQDLRRKEHLAERGVETEAALEAAQARLQAAASRLEAARTRLTRAREDLEDTALRAPYDGTVADRLVEPSERVTAGEPVLEIQSATGGLEATVTVPETLLAAVEIGTEASVTAPALPERMDAVVTEIGTRARASAGFPVTLTILDPPQALLAGMSAEVRLPLRGVHDGIAIPVTALVTGAGQQRSVFVVEGDGIVRRRPVEVIALQDQQIFVEGLEAGEVVVVRGVNSLEEGQRVDLMGVGVARYNP